jgi:hypothetical protein
MGILVDMTTGEFVDTGDFGNLCEYVNALNEMEVEHNLRVFLEDEAYAEVA